MATDHEVAREVAAAAGTVLLALRAGASSGADGASGDLGQRGDRAAHEVIAETLGKLRPHDAVLSEEGAVPGQAPHGGRGAEGETVEGRRWIVDPLDGTREFAEPGRSDWAVHIGLAGADGALLAGAVALPAQGRVLATDARLSVPDLGPGEPRIVVSRSRPPEIAGRLASLLGARLVPMGSAGAKAMAVVDGQAEVYVHAGGQYVWDSCAPVAVARAAGCHASRLDGSSLRYDGADPWLPDLVICHPALAAGVIDALQALLPFEPAPSSPGRAG